MKISRDDLEELLEQVTDYDAENTIRENYSGRGMFGKTCVGLVFDFESEWETFIVVLTAWVKDGGDQLHIPLVEDVRQVVARATKDSMGRTGIIVYWPYGGLTLTD